MNDISYKIVVCGSSVLQSEILIEKYILGLKELSESEGFILEIYHGGCTGVDAYTDKVAKENNIKVYSIPYDEAKDGSGEDKYKNLNTRILDIADPTMVIAFLNPDRENKYSWDMIYKATSKGIDVNIICLKSPLETKENAVVH